ncbi:hypothetical protein ACIQVK_15505 [Streptomyces sp. NPDC090493]|uniref:hypothetical protein n=1 Tax=Streptomyces sp. NPDC090493 TaxID=3365964 RepID=UPI00382A89E2
MNARDADARDGDGAPSETVLLEHCRTAASARHLLALVPDLPGLLRPSVADRLQAGAERLDAAGRPREAHEAFVRAAVLRLAARVGPERAVAALEAIASILAEPSRGSSRETALGRLRGLPPAESQALWHAFLALLRHGVRTGLNGGGPHGEPGEAAGAAGTGDTAGEPQGSSPAVRARPPAGPPAGGGSVAPPATAAHWRALGAGHRRLLTLDPAARPAEWESLVDGLCTAVSALTALAGPPPRRGPASAPDPGVELDERHPSTGPLRESIALLTWADRTRDAELAEAALAFLTAVAQTAHDAPAGQRAYARWHIGLAHGLLGEMRSGRAERDSAEAALTAYGEALATGCEGAVRAAVLTSQAATLVRRTTGERRENLDRALRAAQEAVLLCDRLALPAQRARALLGAAAVHLALPPGEPGEHVAAACAALGRAVALAPAPAGSGPAAWPLADWINAVDELGAALVQRGAAVPARDADRALGLLRVALAARPAAAAPAARAVTLRRLGRAASVRRLRAADGTERAALLAREIRWLREATALDGRPCGPGPSWTGGG